MDGRAGTIPDSDLTEGRLIPWDSTTIVSVILANFVECKKDTA